MSHLIEATPRGTGDGTEVERLTPADVRDHNRSHHDDEEILPYA